MNFQLSSSQQHPLTLSNSTFMRLSLFPNTYHRFCSKRATFNPWRDHMDPTKYKHHKYGIKAHHNTCTDKEKIVVILGPTGSGKSRLSIDLATRFSPSEIINSDKIQVYHGLDVTTNKIPMHERMGIPHHFIGDFDPNTEFTRSKFRSLAESAISKISSQDKLPIIVGGSNSFIYSLVANRFDSEFKLVCTELRYRCCFLWVDVSLPVLNQYLSKRVDDMLDSGMFKELTEFFDSERCPESDSETRTGLRKAIGVPEFQNYYKTFGSSESRWIDMNLEEDLVIKKKVMYEEAVTAIKENTCQLAKRQVGKIVWLRDIAGWDIQRLDATSALRAAMGEVDSDSGGWSDIWERELVKPSMKIVNRFLEE